MWCALCSAGVVLALVLFAPLLLLVFDDWRHRRVHGGPDAWPSL